MNKEALRNDIQNFTNKVDVEKWTDFVRDYAAIGDSERYGGKHGGSDAEHAGAEMIAARLREIGVPQVEIVETPASRYQFNDASLTVVSTAKASGQAREIRPYGYRSPGTSTEGITAELLDVGTATKDEYAELSSKGITVKDKIVLFEGMGTLEAFNLSGQIDESVLNGVAAILIYMTADILNGETIRVQTPLNTLGIPVVGISKADADELKSHLGAGPVTVNLQVDADYTPDEGFTKNVVGTIPGDSDEIIIFTAHLDHFFRCLQDNMASCAACLGIADAVIRSGYRPKRTLVFAFHGSHECGMIDSKYPYITGSYYLVQHKLNEWKNRVIADINFEYAALPLRTLRAGASLGADGNLTKYVAFAPELTGGFEVKGKEPLAYDEYGMFSWVDCISYYVEGAPVYTNDVLTEQLEGNSPYCGRDHSNHDDWGSYSEDALRDSINYYGGFGIYLDQQPYVRIDFSRQADRLYAESEFGELDKEGLPTKGYRRKLDALAKAGKTLTARIDEANYAADVDLAKAAAFNSEMLALNDWFQKKLDMIAPSDFIVTASGRSLYNVSNLSDAAELLKKGDPDSVKEATDKLFEVDLASTSYYFSQAVVDRMRDQVCAVAFASRRTWARGRELPCETFYDIMSNLKRKQDAGESNFKQEIKLINKEVRRETKRFLEELKSEMKVVVEGTERIEKLCQNL